jgi:putative transposase
MYELRKEFNNLRQIEFPFVLEVNNRIYGSAIGNADDAYKRFFKKQTKFPKYKSKKDNKQSFSSDRCLITILDSNRRYKKYKSLFDGYIFYISGKDNHNNDMIGYFIKTSENISFLQNKQIYQITISYDNLNYYVSFNYKEMKNNIYNNHKYDKVGIDLGLKTFATQSDGKISKLPKQKIIKIEKRIKKLQRILSKKEKGSNNYNKVKTKLNKCYKRIANIRKDFLNKYFCLKKAIRFEIHYI